MSLFKKEKRASKPKASLINLFAPNRTQKQAGEVAKTIPIIIGLFNGISDTVSQCSVQTYRTVVRDGQTVEVPVKNPKYLDRPNALQGKYQFWQNVMLSLLYYGNAYIYKLKVNGKVAELHVIHPQDVTIKQEVRFGPKIFQVQGIGEDLTADDMLHISNYGGPESLYGISPVQQAKIFVDSTYSAQTYSAQLNENNLNIAGVIETPKEMKFEEAQKMGQVFAQTHRSDAEGASPIGVLGGGATFKTISLTPEQAQFIESERWNAQKFATLLNVPLFMVDGSAGSWAGTGLQVMNGIYEQRTLKPWIRLIEDAFNTFLLPTGQNMRFNLSEVLKSSPKEEADIFMKIVGAPIMTINEARALKNMAPIDGGDKIVSQNWFTNKEDIDAKAELDQEKLEQEIENLGGEPPGGENN